jgi:ABC-type phosphate/phosphonate transport system ATPase subunit
MALITGAGKTVISTLHSVDLSRQFFDRIIGLREKSIFFDLPTHRISVELLAELYG